MHNSDALVLYFFKNSEDVMPMKRLKRREFSLMLWSFISRPGFYELIFMC